MFLLIVIDEGGGSNVEEGDRALILTALPNCNGRWGVTPESIRRLDVWMQESTPGTWIDWDLGYLIRLA